jgi:SMP-30/Gluconolactonase/LRE-like region
VYKLQQPDGATKPELSVLFEQGKMGLPNGMCWNMVRNNGCQTCMSCMLLTRCNALRWPPGQPGKRISFGCCPPAHLQDKRELYYNDTYAGKVYAMPCTADGTPDTSASWRTIVTLDADMQGSPDGMAIDSDHRLWVAHESGGQVIAYTPFVALINLHAVFRRVSVYGSSLSCHVPALYACAHPICAARGATPQLPPFEQVCCYDATTGEQLHKIDLPVRRPSAVAFGGADLRCVSLL